MVVLENYPFDIVEEMFKDTTKSKVIINKST